MKSKFFLLFCWTGLLFCGPRVFAGQVSESETIVLTLTSGNGADRLFIEQVVTQSGQIYAIYRSVSVADYGIADLQPSTAFAEIYGPSLAVEFVLVDSERYRDLFVVPGTRLTAPKSLYSNRGTNAQRYDYRDATAVKSPWFGEFNATGYPWIYSVAYGWLYVQRAGLIEGSDGSFGSDGTQAVPAARTESSYWFYSPTNGWLWAHESAWPRVYSVAQGRFIQMPAP